MTFECLIKNKHLQIALNQICRLNCSLQCIKFKRMQDGNATTHFHIITFSFIGTVDSLSRN